MADNSIPLGLEQLETLVQVVAQNLLEKWAIEDRFTEEEMYDYVKHSIDDTVFVINNYITLMNDLMLDEATAVGIDI